MRFIFVFLLLCPFLHADPLAELKAKLSAVQPAQALKATVAYESSAQSGDEKNPAIGHATAVVEESGAGLRIQWSRALMDEAVAEELARTKDQNLPPRIRRAMDSLGATTLHDYLNAGPVILRQLSLAELVEETPVMWRGQPARLLSLKITPTVSDKMKKYLKEIKATAKIWLDAEGWPLAAEHTVDVRGRAFLVISFDQHEHHEYEYAQTNGHLVTTRHAKETSGSGGGESGQTKALATIRVDRA